MINIMSYRIIYFRWKFIISMEINFMRIKPAFKAIEISPALTQSIPIPYSLAILYISKQLNDFEANNGKTLSYLSKNFVFLILQIDVLYVLHS